MYRKILFAITKKHKRIRSKKQNKVTHDKFTFSMEVWTLHTFNLPLWTFSQLGYLKFKVQAHKMTLWLVSILIISIIQMGVWYGSYGIWVRLYCCSCSPGKKLNEKLLKFKWSYWNPWNCFEYKVFNYWREITSEL